MKHITSTGPTPKQHASIWLTNLKTDACTDEVARTGRYKGFNGICLTLRQNTPGLPPDDIRTSRRYYDNRYQTHLPPFLPPGPGLEQRSQHQQMLGSRPPRPAPCTWPSRSATGGNDFKCDRNGRQSPSDAKIGPPTGIKPGRTDTSASGWTNPSSENNHRPNDACNMCFPLARSEALDVDDDDDEALAPLDCTKENSKKPTMWGALHRKREHRKSY